MSKTAHTKGPWKKQIAFIENASNHYIVQQDKWGGRNVADCGLSGEGDWDVNEANAALVSAGPELLAGCEDALKYVEAEHPRSPLAVYLRAAIAKATGGAK